MPNPSDELSDLIHQKIETLRPKLLDLSRRNPLISTKLTSRSNSHVRVVDELPDILFFNLNNGQEMRLMPLPPLDDDPKDEEADEFRQALSNARLTDDEYLDASEKLDSSSDDYLDQNRKIDRALKDRVRIQLGMAARPQKTEVNLVQHAKNNGISPSYDLPIANTPDVSEAHADLGIQTLLLPKDLERKLSALASKCNTWIQETGINVLHGAFGFLEWSEPNSTETSFAPLILLQVKFEKRKTREGLEFWASGLDDEPEINAVLSEKLKQEFGIELPAFEGGSVEAYLKEIAELSPKAVTWRVRRQVVFGVFPSARMAMYHDLNTENADFASNGVIRPLLGGSNSGASSPFADEYLVDEPKIERTVPYIVLDADASQFSTLVDVASGKNVAVEGPPGTGKSQTIVNAIAAALASGKKVLFVAEKMAALDVVRSRLESIGLGAFLLPLQAEHSTRENVIKSIRDRVEMSVSRSKHNYDEQVRQFRETRAETAHYIATLSRVFDDSGLTVHEILGKGIAMAARLSSLPRALQLLPFPIRVGLNAETIRSLVDAGAALDAAWRRAAAASQHWKGVKVAGLSRFDTEEILEMAASTARAFETLAQLSKEAAHLNIANFNSTQKLSALAEVLELAARVQDQAHLSLVGSLAEPSAHAETQTFLEHCQEFQRNHDELSRRLPGEITPARRETLEQIQKLCAEHQFDALDLATVTQTLASKRQAIGMARKLASQMKPFASQVPGSEKWRFSDVGKIRELVAEFGREVLQARGNALAEPAAPTILKKLNAAGRQLREDRAALSAHFSSGSTASLDELIECQNAIKNAGGLRALNPAYRRATRLYQRLTSAKYSRLEAIQWLEKMIDWKKREAEFTGDVQCTMLYTIHFRGVDTDFDFIERLANFYENARERFPKLDQKPIREFLIFGDFEALLQVPTLEAYPEAVHLKVVEDGIGRLEAEANAREAACAQLRTLTTALGHSADVQVAHLPELKLAIENHLSEKSRLDNHAVIAVLLGRAFKGANTRANELSDLMFVAKTIAQLGADRNTAASLIATGAAQKAADLARELARAMETAKAREADLKKRVNLDQNAPLFAGSLEDNIRSLSSAAADEEGLIAHAEVFSAKGELRESLHELIDAYFTARGNFEGLGEALEALAIRSLAKRVFDSYGAPLTKFSGSKLEELRSKLAALDKSIIKSSREVLKAQLKDNAKAPYGNGVGKKSTWTEMALIENEISKKQRFIPVRDLTRRAAKAMQELKPCWMMSPLAVAQFLPKGLLTFDLCIIDEASQMPPEDSVGALARSKQAMIVGDTNQLPPSSFFRKMIDDEEADEDETVLSESILELANATFRPARRLRWHYRSRHSGLIKFSNRLVYNDDLVVFPSATELMGGMGVEFRAVEGRYKSGTNAIEAQEVVKAAIQFMKDDPNRSLGIVTLNQKQRDLIFEEMEFAISKDAAAARYVEFWAEYNDGLEDFFIKNLENVQGDERDVIFIGTVYGPEEPGAKVMQRFGPINGLAGKRRLNVLFSRAKQQIVTFSSMTAGDILAEPTGNEGAYMLKRWLEYSATGVLETGEVAHKEPDSDLEIFVMDQIRAMGCNPVPQVGVKGYSIDIGVKHPLWEHGFILGVECDGASFHSSKSARDRDRLRQEVLEGLGWRFHRIWSTDWFNSPAKQAAILRGVINDRLAELKTREAEFVRKPRTVPNAAITPLKPDIASPPEKSSTKAEQEELALRPVTGRVSVGDTVRVRYLSEDKKVVQFTISADHSDPDSGVIHFKKPIAEALLGAEEGEEVELLVGSYLRQAILEKIVSRAG
jgi:hypothetical protein